MKLSVTTKPNLILGFIIAILLYLKFGNNTEDESEIDDRFKVPVDFFVMSKCPDAVVCENHFTDVMDRVGNIINLDINFIGKLNSTDPKFGVTCMHGDSECQGNVQELCARKISPDRWYQFILCLNRNYPTIGLPNSNLDLCLKTNSIPITPYRKCLTEGGSLLRSSITKSHNLNISKSCTILINKGQSKCIHDNGKWKECQNGHSITDFIHQICKAYQGPPTPECKKSSSL